MSSRATAVLATLATGCKRPYDLLMRLVADVALSAVGGHNNAVVSGNNFNGALFGGTRSYACDAGAITPPFQAAIWSPYTTSGGSYQSGITSLVDFSFLIVGRIFLPSARR